MYCGLKDILKRPKLFKSQFNICTKYKYDNTNENEIKQALTICKPKSEVFLTENGGENFKTKPPIFLVGLPIIILLCV